MNYKAVERLFGTLEGAIRNEARIASVALKLDRQSPRLKIALGFRKEEVLMDELAEKLLVKARGAIRNARTFSDQRRSTAIVELKNLVAYMVQLFNKHRQLSRLAAEQEKLAEERAGRQ